MYLTNKKSTIVMLKSCINNNLYCYGCSNNTLRVKFKEDKLTIDSYCLSKEGSPSRSICGRKPIQKLLLITILHEEEEFNVNGILL